MKLLSLIITLLFSINLSATPLKDLVCFTQGHLTSSYSLNLSSTGKYELTVNHHNGVLYAPIHKGIVTTKDIEHLKVKSDIITKLGANYKINFEAKNCRFQEDFITCSSSADKRVNNLDVKNYSFSLIKETRVSPFGEYTAWLAHVDVMREGDNFVYNTVTRYQVSDCFFKKK